jgi:hypothetical protein
MNAVQYHTQKSLTDNIYMEKNITIDWTLFIITLKISSFSKIIDYFEVNLLWFSGTILWLLFFMSEIPPVCWWL